MERLIRVGHLKQNVRTVGGQRETTQDLVVQTPITSTTPKVVINYIHKGPADEKYNSKQKRQRLLRVAFVRERINSIQHNLPDGSMRPVDDTITFFMINANCVLQPHKDTLILTLGISGFNVRRVLIDPSSSANLLQISAYRQMGFPSFALENPGRIVSRFNWATMTSLGDVVLLVQAGPITLNVRFSVVEDLSPFNAIMGREWLHSMKVIPSTKLNFLNLIW